MDQFVPVLSQLPFVVFESGSFDQLCWRFISRQLPLPIPLASLPVVLTFPECVVQGNAIGGQHDRQRTWELVVIRHFRRSLQFNAP
jgi:hypothetical protein